MGLTLDENITFDKKLYAFHFKIELFHYPANSVM